MREWESEREGEGEVEGGVRNELGLVWTAEETRDLYQERNLSKLYILFFFWVHFIHDYGV